MKSAQFCGDTSECCPKYLDSYIRMRSELEMTNEQKVECFRHLLHDYALDFFGTTLKINRIIPVNQ